MLKNQKGFTLIEIIAVLVILGILAAVAVPRYFNMQADAQRNAVLGAVAALQSTATQDYAQKLLTTPSVTTYIPGSNTPAVVGDFTGSIAISGGTIGNTTVTVTAGPAWFIASNMGSFASRSFRLY